MKEKERVQQDSAGEREGSRNDKAPITSNSVKNAHASGDGSMRRSLDSIPDEEEDKKGQNTKRQSREQY